MEESGSDLRRLIASALLICAFVAPALAQEAPDAKVAALEKRLKALEQKQPPVTPTKEQKKANKDQFVKVCDERGLKLKEVHVDAMSGNSFIVCH